MSHDSVNRFLNRESYSPQDLFNEVKPGINLRGGTLSVDDSVLDKPYAHYIALLGHYWSGKNHAVVKGINLITLYYTDPHGQHQPVNFRVYDNRAIKQVCHIESFQVRGKVAVKNHIFAAICGYVKLQHMRATDVIKNCYQLQCDLFNEVISAFITTFAPSMNHLNPQFLSGVNA